MSDDDRPCCLLRAISELQVPLPGIPGLSWGRIGHECVGCGRWRRRYGCDCGVKYSRDLLSSAWVWGR
jgi:hypothetical protein